MRCRFFDLWHRLLRHRNHTEKSRSECAVMIARSGRRWMDWQRNQGRQLIFGWSERGHSWFNQVSHSITIYTVSESYEESGTTWWGQKSQSLLQRRRQKSRKQRQTDRNWETTWNSVHLVRGDCRSRCRLLRQLDESDAKGETMTCDLSAAADLYELISSYFHPQMWM